MSVGQSDLLQKSVTSRLEYAALLSRLEDKTSGRSEAAQETANTPSLSYILKQDLRY